jgi:TusA-related sulfurtransferase
MKETFIDLKNVACPMNFVRIKIKLESLEVGDILKAQITGNENLESVKNSILAEEQEVVKVEAVDDPVAAEVFELTICKKV